MDMTRVDNVFQMTRRLTPAHWVRYSEACGMAPDHTLAIFDEFCRIPPEALSGARAEARHADENLHPEDIARRIVATIAHVLTRGHA